MLLERARTRKVLRKVLTLTIQTQKCPKNLRTRTNQISPTSPANQSLKAITIWMKEMFMASTGYGRRRSTTISKTALTQRKVLSQSKGRTRREERPLLKLSEVMMMMMTMKMSKKILSNPKVRRRRRKLNNRTPLWKNKMIWPESTY